MTNTKVLKEASYSRIYLPVLLATSTGMRKGEILGLRWRDINFEERTISVVQTLQRNSNGLEYRQPKTKKSRRLIELPASVVEELKKHRLQQKKERLLLGEAYKDNDLVCCWPDGSPLKPDWVSRNWQNLCKKLGIKRVRYHDLRHTHSTLLMSWGVPTKVISERLGHSNTQITDDIYSHVLPGIQREVAKLLEERIFARIYKDTKAQSSV